jgi:hypothetical protein
MHLKQIILLHQIAKTVPNPTDIGLPDMLKIVNFVFFIFTIPQKLVVSFRLSGF